MALSCNNEIYIQEEDVTQMTVTTTIGSSKMSELNVQLILNIGRSFKLIAKCECYNLLHFSVKRGDS